ncbi:MAG: hypothetical protein AAF993_02185 [Pseudomonadota bacterium]
MDDSQKAADSYKAAEENQQTTTSQDNHLSAPQHAEIAEQYAGWSVSGEATDVGFVLGYN